MKEWHFYRFLELLFLAIAVSLAAMAISTVAIYFAIQPPIGGVAYMWLVPATAIFLLGVPVFCMLKHASHIEYKWLRRHDI